MNLLAWHTRRLAVCLPLIALTGCGESVTESIGETLVDPGNQAPDPVVVDVPVAFIKRDIPLSEDGELITRDLRRPEQFIPGAGLYIKARALASAEEINITDKLFVEGEVEQELRPQYDIKDLEVSYDGTRLLFALRFPEDPDADDDQQPTWNIWEYDLPSDTLTRLIASDIIAEAGQDTGPAYLPDGRIVFSSTRQRSNQAILLDEGKPQYAGLEESLNVHASVLHVMNADGSGIEQISFNQSHDLDPLVMSDGSVLFTRWDRAVSDKGMHLYRINPDGSNLELVYGRHSHQQNGRTEQFVQSRETEQGQVLVALREYREQRLGGDFALLNTDSFIDLDVPVANGSGGKAQARALFDTVDTNADISPGGYFAAVYPLWDGSGRQLFTWSQCRVIDPLQMDVAEGEQRKILPCSEELLATDGIEAAPPLYGMWMFDPVENTQLTLGIPQEGTAYTEVVAMEQRPFPADAPQSEIFDQSLADANRGAFHIRSVYDFAGVDNSPQGIAVLSDPSQTAPAERPSRFLRIVKPVSMPDDDVIDLDGTDFGRSRAQLMRDIIGYVPIEPDGSVQFQVPANLPIAISILDQNGRRISPRHQNWLQVGPGEVRTCNGCHTSDDTTPHGQLAAEPTSINPGAASEGNPFPNASVTYPAGLGETMAQARARVDGIPYPQADIVFDDVWSDTSQTTPAASFQYAYQDMQSALPVSQSCALNWTDTCRITVNFPDHIQPVFNVVRQTFDTQGNLVSDQTCITCHAPMDANDMAQVPAAQLDLTDSASDQNADHTTAYRELMFGDNEQEVIEGALLDRRVIVTDADGNTVFETDENGDLILDANGDPIPVTRTVRVGNSMSTSGALASGRFFNVFEASHAGWLSPAELKLFSEWLDIGGQYYNNPFDTQGDSQ